MTLKRPLTPEEDLITGTIISVLERTVIELRGVGMPDDAICVGLLNAVVSHAYRSQAMDPKTLAKSFRAMAKMHAADVKDGVEKMAKLADRLTREANNVG
jgi:hypothetical protein